MAISINFTVMLLSLSSYFFYGRQLNRAKNRRHFRIYRHEYVFHYPPFVSVEFFYSLKTCLLYVVFFSLHFYILLHFNLHTFLCTIMAQTTSIKKIDCHILVFGTVCNFRYIGVPALIHYFNSISMKYAFITVENVFGQKLNLKNEIWCCCMHITAITSKQWL